MHSFYFDFKFENFAWQSSIDSYISKKLQFSFKAFKWSNSFIDTVVILKFIKYLLGYNIGFGLKYW
jgi:hypothetical protein